MCNTPRILQDLYLFYFVFYALDSEATAQPALRSFLRQWQARAIAI